MDGSMKGLSGWMDESIMWMDGCERIIWMDERSMWMMDGWIG